MNILAKRGVLDNIATFEHICDTTADMANIPADEINLGSTCLVLEGEDGGFELYMAKSNKEWVLLGGGGSDEEEPEPEEEP